MARRACVPEKKELKWTIPHEAHGVGMAQRERAHSYNHHEMIVGDGDPITFWF